MAETRKTAAAKSAARTTAAKAEEVKDEAVKETKKTTAKKTAAKKTTDTKEVKETKPTGKTPGRKPAVKSVVHLQFSGKEHTTEELVQSAKDIWKYDLDRNPEDFKSVELYVKPEESKVYYVINGEVNGVFDI